LSEDKLEVAERCLTSYTFPGIEIYFHFYQIGLHFGKIGAKTEERNFVLFDQDLPKREGNPLPIATAYFPAGFFATQIIKPFNHSLSNLKHQG